MQFQEKRINQTQENDKKPHFGLGLGQLGTNLGCQLFFIKHFVASVTRYHGELSSCKISEKTNDLILRKFSEGRTDGQTDGHRDRQRISQQN